MRRQSSAAYLHHMSAPMWAADTWRHLRTAAAAAFRFKLDCSCVFRKQPPSLLQRIKQYF